MKEQLTNSWVDMSGSDAPYLRGQPEGLCGTTILTIVAETYGLKNKITPEELASIVGATAEQGTSHKQMFEGAKKLGLVAAQVTNVDLGELNEVRLAGGQVIVNWMAGDKKEDGHYSLLRNVNDSFVTLIDTELGGQIRTFERDNFEKRWFDFDEDEQGNEVKVERWALITWNPRWEK